MASFPGEPKYWNSQAPHCYYSSQLSSPWNRDVQGVRNAICVTMMVVNVPEEGLCEDNMEIGGITEGTPGGIGVLI